MYVVVLFSPWFNFYFHWFLGMVMCDNELETKDRIEPQHVHSQRVINTVPDLFLTSSKIHHYTAWPNLTFFIT